MERLGKYKMTIVRQLTKYCTKSIVWYQSQQLKTTPSPVVQVYFEFNFANFVKVILAKLRWCVKKKRAIKLSYL